MGKRKNIGIILHKINSNEIGKADAFILEKMEKLVESKVEQSTDKEKMIKKIYDRLDHIAVFLNID